MLTSNNTIQLASHHPHLLLNALPFLSLTLHSISRLLYTYSCYTHRQFQVFYTSASAMHGCRQMAAGGSGRLALPVKALKAGQESYWLDQIARNREEYFSGRGESPGR
jgi:hypothetical protein